MEGFKLLSNNYLINIQRQELAERLAIFNKSEVDGISVDVCDDLTLVKTSQMTPWEKMRWRISKRSSWLKESLYHINPAHTALSLELIEKEIANNPEKEKELITLFDQAVYKFNNLQYSKTKYETLTLSIHRAVLQEDLKAVIQLIVSNYAYLYLCNSHGETPLHIALKMGCRPIIHFLISEFPLSKDLSIKDNIKGDTPLHLAVAANDIATCELLLRKSVDATIPNFANITPLSLAQQKGYRHIYQILYQHSAKRYNRYFS